MDEYRIDLTDGSSHDSGVFSTTEDDDRCHIILRYRGREIGAEASDFFEALCQIRLQLEKEGLTPVCYGASLNVYPSGMCRDMGSGLKAYKMEKGKHAKMKDLVDIFAVGPDVVPASVAQQREFWEQWLEMPRV